MTTRAIEEALRGRLDEGTLNRLIAGFLSAPHISAWIKGLDRRYIFVSPGWEEHSGVPRERAIGHTDEEFRPASVAGRFRAVDDRIVAEGTTETREDQVATSDGVRSFMTTKFPLLDKDGAIIAIAGISAETTDFRSLKAETLANRDLLISVVESTSDCILRYRPDLTITFANPAFLALFAAAGSPVEGRNLREVFSAEDADRFVASCAQLSPRHPQASFDKPSRDRFGKSRWRLWRQRGVFDADGRLVEVQASGRDVTEERLYQQALERIIATAKDLDLALPHVLSEAIAVGLDVLEFDVGIVTRIIDESTIYRHVQRHDRTLVESGPAENGPDMLSAALLDTSETLAIEEVARSRFANHRTHLSFGVNAFAGQRIEVAGTLLGTVAFYGFKPRARPFRPTEIMLLRILAQWLAFAIDRDERTRALSESRAELAMILEHMPAHIFYKDGAGRLLNANATARGSAPPTESQALDQRILDERRPLVGKVERWETADGAGQWMRTDRIPFELRTTGEHRLLVVATDVSRLVEKEQALAKANEGLNQFAYIASHDLQEPLRKIGTFTDLLMEGLDSGNREDIDYAVRVIKDSARRASLLISDLLAWSRLTSRTLDRVPIAFAAFVRDILADVLSTRSGVSTEVVDRMEPLTVSADPTPLRQLIENLLTNAVKYRHPDRDLVLTFDLAQTPEGGIRFSIGDNGIGFDPAYRQVIFEPFRRLHSDRRYSGTGVGLAICRRVCERHGWVITAEGSPGEGATFVITMPRGTI